MSLLAFVGRLIANAADAEALERPLAAVMVARHLVDAVALEQLGKLLRHHVGG